jgi:DNA polymerase III delta prime subunit
MLTQLLKEKRFPSPLILEASDRTAAFREIAGFTLCGTQSNCAHCRDCKQVAKGFHPDWLILKGAVKIEEVRETLFRLRQRPFQSTIRLLTFDDAQEANQFVQNALLKTLEEPLAHWILVLGVNSKLSLLQTIRSRCLVYKIPEDPNAIELSNDEEKIFRSIQDANDLAIQKDLEGIFKDRQKTKTLFQRLLVSASNRQHPGHWKNLSPFLEDTLAELVRNLNPRLVWDRAWARSHTEAL